MNIQQAKQYVSGFFTFEEFVSVVGGRDDADVLAAAWVLNGIQEPDSEFLEYEIEALYDILIDSGLEFDYHKSKSLII